MVKTEGKWPTDISSWRVVKRLDISDHRMEKDVFQPQAKFGFFGYYYCDLGPAKNTMGEAISWIEHQCRDRAEPPKEQVVWCAGHLR